MRLVAEMLRSATNIKSTSNYHDSNLQATSTETLNNLMMRAAAREKTAFFRLSMSCCTGHVPLHAQYFLTSLFLRSPAIFLFFKLYQECMQCTETV